METYDQQTPTIEEQLADLVKEAEKINQAILNDGASVTEEVDAIVADINKTADRIRQICIDFPQAEANANDIIDRSILEDAEAMDDND